MDVAEPLRDTGLRSRALETYQLQFMGYREQEAFL